MEILLGEPTCCRSSPSPALFGRTTDGIRFWFSRHGQKARSALFRRLYRDLGGGPEDCMIVAGVARSGTTWLAEIIRSQVSARVMFEPFHARFVQGFRGFQYIPYRRPDVEDPRLLAFSTDVLSGDVRDPFWIDRGIDCLRPQHRIVKEVRVCLFLAWLRRRFPETPVLFIVRHPCAVSASFARLGWSSDQDLASMLGQEDLVEDYLGDRLEVIGNATTAHQKHAVIWCINNLVALDQLHGEGVLRLHYEDLLARPTHFVPLVFDTVGRPFDDSVYHRIGKPSRTTWAGALTTHRAEDVPAWKSELDADQIEEVLEIVTAFGLDHLYDRDGTPSGTLYEGG